jgi:hypothetical protein
MYRRPPATPILLPAALAAVLAGCASQSDAPAPVAAVRPSPNVYFYPLHGQTASQQDRDRYECYRWAHHQTGYDPSLPRQDGAAAVQVVAGPPPGYAVAAGAATGAVIGAAVSQPWDTAEGAAIGAVAGGLIGAAAEASQQQAQGGVAQANAQADVAVTAYRDAMKSCLAARGYSVQ